MLCVVPTQNCLEENYGKEWLFVKHRNAKVQTPKQKTRPPRAKKPLSLIEPDPIADAVEEEKRPTRKSRKAGTVVDEKGEAEVAETSQMGSRALCRDKIMNAVSESSSLTDAGPHAVESENNVPECEADGTPSKEKNEPEVALTSPSFSLADGVSRFVSRLLGDRNTPTS